MTRSVALPLLLLASGHGALLAQASEFSVRGLGLPVLPASVRGQGMGGSLTLLDAEATLNPASVAGLRVATASFNLRQYWRSSRNPFGSDGGTDTQFPLVFVGGPIGPRWTVSISAAGLTDRTFSVGREDTVTVRDVPVAVHDTLSSRGGLTELQLAGSYRVNSWLALGAGVRAVTGLNRIEFRRTFEDPDYASVRTRNEWSGLAPGASLGLLAEPAARLRLAALIRVAGDLRIDIDSTHVTRQPMPVTLAAGLGWQFGPTLLATGHVLHRNWSVADSSIRDRGGVGARNTMEWAVGVEWLRNRTNPFRFPLRLGVRHADLPFPLEEGQTAGEWMVAMGTGVRFAGGRGSLDLALERTWRSDGAAYRERGFMVSAGLGVRP